MPSEILLAVTDDRLYAFKYKPAGFKMKVKEEVAAWNRADVDVTAETRKVTTQVAIHDRADDQSYELELTSVGGGADGLVDWFLDSLDVRGS